VPPIQAVEKRLSRLALLHDALFSEAVQRLPNTIDRAIPQESVNLRRCELCICATEDLEDIAVESRRDHVGAPLMIPLGSLAVALGTPEGYAANRNPGTPVLHRSR